MHKLTLFDCQACIWYMPEWLCSFQQLVFVCDKCSKLRHFEKANYEKCNIYPVNMFCCKKTSFVGSNIARLCKHDECEHKKRLNLSTQCKISTAFCDFIPKCRNWRIFDAVKDKNKKRSK